MRKLENERGALHMEVSVLSEQVDAQSNKIYELESILQDKKESLRHMEEALQRVSFALSAFETLILNRLNMFYRKFCQEARWKPRNWSSSIQCLS